MFVWLVVSTHLKNISQSQNGSFPQVGMNIKNVSNHHLVVCAYRKRKPPFFWHQNLNLHRPPSPLLSASWLSWQRLWGGVNEDDWRRGNFQTFYTPLKINMEHNYGGLQDRFPCFSWVICRFQPLIFQGVHVCAKTSLESLWFAVYSAVTAPPETTQRMKVYKLDAPISWLNWTWHFALRFLGDLLLKSDISLEIPCWYEWITRLTRLLIDVSSVLLLAFLRKKSIKWNSSSCFKRIFLRWL